jgi:hypothetical protein
MENELEIEVSKLSPIEGDLVVLTVPDNLTVEELSYLQQTMEQMSVPCKVLILPASIKIQNVSDKQMEELGWKKILRLKGI